jgi:hypothetical protein
LYPLPMLEAVKQWLAQNELWLYPLAALLTILTVFKAIPKLWSFLKRPFTARRKQPRVTLRLLVDILNVVGYSSSGSESPLW